MSFVSQQVQSLEQQPLLLRQIFSPSPPHSLTKMETGNLNLSDSQKLDKLLIGFQSLQTQYEEVKAANDIILDECRALKEENKRLKQALLSLSNGSGKDYLKCEDLLQEFADLKDAVANGREELEDYKRMLEECNVQLKAALDGLRFERAKKCSCFICRFTIWAGLKK